MDLYVLELMFAGLQVRVELNGVELVADDSAASKTVGYRLNPYLIEGKNRLRAALRLPPPQNDKGSPSFQAKAPESDFSLRLIVGVKGVDPGQAGINFQYEWDAVKTPLPSGAWSLVVDQIFAPPSAFGRWSWEDAPAQAPTSADMGDIIEEVRALHVAAASRDIPRMVEALGLKHAELARALGANPQVFRDDLAVALSTIFSAADCQVAPLDSNALKLEPMAEGRLVRVPLADGTAPIKLSGGGEITHILPIFTRLSGRWVLVR